MRAARSDRSRLPGSPGAPEETLASLRHQLDEEQRHSKLVAAFFSDAAQAAADDRSVFQALAERASEAVGDSAVATLVTDDGEWLEAVGVYHPDPERQEQIRTAVARRRRSPDAPTPPTRRFQPGWSTGHARVGGTSQHGIHAMYGRGPVASSSQAGVADPRRMSPVGYTNAAGMDVEWTADWTAQSRATTESLPLLAGVVRAQGPGCRHL